MLSQLKFGPPPATSMQMEYSGLECAIELVDGVDDAVSHIHKYGSSHTDCIVTDDGTSYVNGHYVNIVELLHI